MGQFLGIVSMEAALCAGLESCLLGGRPFVPNVLRGRPFVPNVLGGRPFVPNALGGETFLCLMRLGGRPFMPNVKVFLHS